nr:MAG TPA: hypothetical protein [Caudoviricetes sp.]
MVNKKSRLLGSYWGYQYNNFFMFESSSSSNVAPPLNILNCSSSSYGTLVNESSLTKEGFINGGLNLYILLFEANASFLSLPAKDDILSTST